MRYATHARPQGQVQDADALPAGEQARYFYAEESSLQLKRAIDAAIRSQAHCWGITFEQTRSLLLDRKKVAA